MNIDTSLLREKFTIDEKNATRTGSALKIICPSTRMSIHLQAGGLATETFVVRTQNMHSCARMVAQIIHNYEKKGPLMKRTVALDWDELWYDALNKYERTYNDGRWVSVYHKGRLIHSSGDYHPFLDIIEQCDAINKEGNYEHSLKMAENAFSKAGKDVTINYESNVALVAVISRHDGRCSMVLRGPDKNTTFNYSLKPLDSNKILSIPQVLSTAADFLEGVQLSYMVGINNEKMNQHFIEKYSDEGRQTRAAKKRVERLNAQINSMENRYNVRYRPERPNFDYLISTTEKFAQSHLLDDDNAYSD